MSRSILLTVLLCLLNHGADPATAWDDKDFFSYCPPQTCGDGPEIRFPLWFESSNASSPTCRGAVSTKLVCSGNRDTTLLHPFLGASKVTAVDYKNAAMKIIPLIGYSACPIKELTEPAHSSACPIEELSDANVFEGGCDLYNYNLARLVYCSREFMPSDAQLGNFFDSGGAAGNIAGPIPCLSSNPVHFTYLVHADLPMALLPSDCKLVSTREVHIPYLHMSPSPVTFKEKVEAILGPSEMTITWREGPRESKPTLNCTDCEESGHRCAFSSQRNQTFCMPKGSHVGVIGGTAATKTFFLCKERTKGNKAIFVSTEWQADLERGPSRRWWSSPERSAAAGFVQHLGGGGRPSVQEGRRT